MIVVIADGVAVVAVVAGDGIAAVAMMVLFLLIVLPLVLIAVVAADGILVVAVVDSAVCVDTDCASVSDVNNVVGFPPVLEV